MIMKLLIAAKDSDYVEHLSKVISDKYSDTFEIYVCSSEERLRDVLTGKRYDIALMEPEFVGLTGRANIKLPLVFRSPDGSSVHVPAGIGQVSKYQRIASLVGDILEKYARSNPEADVDRSNIGRVIAFWSPAGGVGKTSAALAYAAQMVSRGKKVVYLSLQAFSDGASYFPQNGKSISTIFGSGSGSLSLLAQSIRLLDQGSGIMYFCDPTNYDDISELTADDVEDLLLGCAYGADELVVDLPGEWNGKVSRTFNLADTVIAVIDQRSGAKWAQFTEQHNAYDQIRGKLKIAVNKGGSPRGVELRDPVLLPFVQSNDPIVVYKTLSAYFA